MSKPKRGGGTYIYDCFEHWSVEDCACIHCINYAGKGKPCPLDKCCIEDIKEGAVRREAAARKRKTEDSL
ncbi:MAG: hypothetical protein FWE24_08725 [Defluviitaleaceae bacterium]|nr:hypothetical protein [Defluviitaleaceae bacterium]